VGRPQKNDIMKKKIYLGLVLGLIIYVFLFYLFKPVILRVLISIIFIIAALLIKTINKKNNE
jgi:predicted RND superfamily exporter protein